MVSMALDLRYAAQEAFYSCSTSTTSRPLYWPQCGQARCGNFCSWQLGHSDNPDCFRRSCARRLPLRAA